MGYAQVREVTIDEDGRLQVDGLPVRAGDHVQVVVIRRQPAAGGLTRYPLHGQPLRYETPFDPAVDPSDWEANK